MKTHQSMNRERRDRRNEEGEREMHIGVHLYSA
jgi:hypothetical protein